VTILCWLDRIQFPDRPLVGEKAFVSSELQRRRYPIIEGFVVLSATFQEFFENLNHSESILTDFPYSSLYLDVNDSKALQLVARESRRVILQATLPPEWLSELTEAVARLQTDALIWRFSLPPTLARQSRGLLPALTSRTTPSDLENSLKRAWAELFTARSLFYWRRMGIGLETVRLALLVQPLVNATCSGNVIIDPHCLQIEATWGLGQSLIDGRISPDFYLVDRASQQLLSQQLGNKSQAYSLDSGETPISARLLTNEEQETYCLTTNTLDRLVGLLQSLCGEYPQLKTIQWLIAPDERIYLLNGYSEEAFASPLDSLHFPLKGLAASPGSVSGVARIVTDFDSPRENFENSILVTSSLPPHRLSHLKHLKGIITEHGGMTSHGAILARELGIPAIVGVPAATQILRSGETIFLDGTMGIVSRRETAIAAIAIASQPSQAIDPTPVGTRLMVNISQTDSISRVLSLPVDGIGLLRSEWMILELLSRRSLEEWLHLDHQAEFIEELARLIGKFATSFAPRPIFYRSLDGMAGADPKEYRGTHAYTLDPTLFDLELQALRRVQTTTAKNINLILPFVRGIEEFIFCRERARQSLLTQDPAFQLWIMAEVPSVIFQLGDYVRSGVQGIAIGTNDLTQWLLGIDRDRPSPSEPLNARHPALLIALKQIIQQARCLNIPCSVCGMAIVQNPDLIDDLVRWGVTTLSVDPNSVLSTREAIVRAERRLLLETARERAID
jgi:pyruvate,water dikinase